MTEKEQIVFPELLPDSEIDRQIDELREFEQRSNRPWPTDQERYEQAMCLIFDQFGRIYDRIELM